MTFDSPFHESELAIQERSGQQADAEANSPMIADKLFAGALNFIRQQQMGSFPAPADSRLLDTTNTFAATMVSQQHFGDHGLMSKDETKRAAQEFLAVQLTEAVQIEEERLNSEAAAALAPKVWKRVAETFIAQCEGWNTITKQESLSCKETILGDLRIRCAGKPDIITVHYDSKKLQVIFRNTARPEHEGDSTFFIQGYNGGTEADLSRNNQRANLDVVVLGELRVLAGIGRTAK